MYLCMHVSMYVYIFFEMIKVKIKQVVGNLTCNLLYACVLAFLKQISQVVDHRHESVRKIFGSPVCMYVCMFMY